MATESTVVEMAETPSSPSGMKRDKDDAVVSESGTKKARVQSSTEKRKASKDTPRPTLGRHIGMESKIYPKVREDNIQEVVVKDSG